MKNIVTVLALSIGVMAPAFAEEEIKDHRPVALIDVRDIRDCTSQQEPNQSRRPWNQAYRSPSPNRQGLADLLEDTLVDSGLYRVVTKKSIERGLKDQELFDFLNGDKQGEIKFKKPGYRIEMDVLTYNVKKTESTNKKTKKHGKSSEKTTTTINATVKMAFKVIDMKTGETFLSEKFASTLTDESIATMKKKKHGRMHEKAGKALSDEEIYLANATDNVMDDFCEMLKNIQPFHIIACTDDGILTLDAPSSVAKVGDIMEVFSLGQPVVSKRTGKTTRSETKVATIKVTNANDDGSTAIFDNILTADCDWHVIVRRVKKTEKPAAPVMAYPFPGLKR